MCQRSLNATESFLKSARTLYNCLKPFYKFFFLPEASRTILKLPETSKCYWKPFRKCEASRIILNVSEIYKFYWELSKKCQSSLEPFRKFYIPLNSIEKSFALVSTILYFNLQRVRSALPVSDIQGGPVLSVNNSPFDS